MSIKPYVLLRCVPPPKKNEKKREVEIEFLRSRATGNKINIISILFALITDRSKASHVSELPPRVKSNPSDVKGD